MNTTRLQTVLSYLAMASILVGCSLLHPGLGFISWGLMIITYISTTIYLEIKVAALKQHTDFMAELNQIKERHKKDMEQATKRVSQMDLEKDTVGPSAIGRGWKIKHTYHEGDQTLEIKEPPR